MNIKTLTYDQLEEWVRQHDMPKYRAAIIWKWIYQKKATSFEEMTNLSLQDRKFLEEHARISTHLVVETRVSRHDGTTKYLFELDDKNRIESVYIPSPDHATLCISSQVGCAQQCAFCATGTMGLIRNLEWHEIVEQVMAVQRDGKDIQYVVFMGMGEPLNNYEQVVQSIRIINDPKTIGIGARRITVSTCGVVPAIKKLADDDLGVNLAVSLNAAGNNVRSRIMPVNTTFPIGRVIEAAQYYQKASGRRVTFEYVLIGGVNDSTEDAANLARLLDGLICHVNLIGYNPVEGIARMEKSPNMGQFVRILTRNHISVSVRQSAGTDIAGACGQLVVKGL